MGWQMSKHLREAFIDHALRNTAYTPPASTWLALVTSIPDDEDGGLEVTGGSYARQELTWQPAAAGVVDSATGPEFAPVHSGAAQTICGAKIFDADTDGNPLFYVSFDGAFVVEAGKTLTFADDWASLTRSSSSAFTTFAIGKWLDLVLNGTSWPSPASVWLGAYTDLVDETGTGTEVTGGSYGRVEVTFSAPAGHGDTTGGAVSFAPLQHDEDTDVVSFAISDDATAGDVLLFTPARADGTALAVPANNDLVFPEGAVTARIR